MKWQCIEPTDRGSSTVSGIIATLVSPFSSQQRVTSFHRYQRASWEEEPNIQREERHRVQDYNTRWSRISWLSGRCAFTSEGFHSKETIMNSHTVAFHTAGALLEAWMEAHTNNLKHDSLR